MSAGDSFQFISRDRILNCLFENCNIDNDCISCIVTADHFGFEAFQRTLCYNNFVSASNTWVYIDFLCLRKNFKLTQSVQLTNECFLVNGNPEQLNMYKVFF